MTLQLIDYTILIMDYLKYVYFPCSIFGIKNLQYNKALDIKLKYLYLNFH